MSVILYLLKTVLISGILYGYYRIFLQNRPFHQYNRILLLGIPVLSLVLPALQLAIPEFSSASATSRFLPLISMQGKLEESVTIYAREGLKMRFLFNRLAIGLSLTISAILAYRFFRTCLYLRRLARTEVERNIQDARIHLVSDPGTPFSFFNDIFWNVAVGLDSPAAGQMLKHELYHVIHKHSLDIVALELFRIFCWFNPFLYLIFREMRALHEFQADRCAFTEADRLEYAQLLLVGNTKTSISLINPFFQNQIKRRITMIINKQKNKHSLLARILLLPILALVVILFSFRYKAPSFANVPDKKDTLFLENVSGITPESIHSLMMDKDKGLVFIKLQDGTEAMIPVSEEMKDGYVELKQDGEAGTAGGNYKLRSMHVDMQRGQVSLKFLNGKDEMIMTANRFTQSDPNAGPTFTKVEIEAEYPGGMAAWQEFLQKNVKYPEDAAKKEIQGDVLLQFIVEKDGTLSQITAISGPEELKAESIRVISISGKWKPAKQNGHIVRSYHRQPIHFRLERQ